MFDSLVGGIECRWSPNKSSGGWMVAVENTVSHIYGCLIRLRSGDWDMIDFILMLIRHIGDPSCFLDGDI